MNVRYEPAASAEVTVAVLWYLEVAGVAVADAFEWKLHAAGGCWCGFHGLARQANGRAANCG